jgi:RNA polymerase sigma factor for flagellar operon FliA
MDPFSRRTRKYAKKIETAVRETEQALGRAATDEEVSTRLQIPVSQFERWREATAPVRIVSLDTPAASDGSSNISFHDMLADDHQEGAPEKMEKEELVELLTDHLAELPDREKKILALYYFEGLRMVEIAEVFNLTQCRVSQIHKEAVGKLRKTLHAARQK